MTLDRLINIYACFRELCLIVGFLNDLSKYILVNMAERESETLQTITALYLSFQCVNAT